MASMAKRLLIASFLLAFAVPSLATPIYSVLDLGTLGGQNSFAQGINNQGDVVGESDLADFATHAFVYTNGEMRDLGTLGGRDSSAFAISDSGMIVGSSAVGNDAFHAFLFSEGVMQDLGSLTGPEGSSRGRDVNNSGQVVGTSRTASGQDHAFLYVDGVMSDLGTLPTHEPGYSTGEAINERGHVIGNSAHEYIGPNAYAFLYDGTTMTALPSAASRLLVARDINNLDQVVGVDFYSQGAFLYDGGVVIDLDSGGTSYFTVAQSVNDLGQVVGRGQAVGQTVDGGFLWDRDNGVRYLNDLINPELRWSIRDAMGINDQGQIAATGYDEYMDTYHALLLSPIPAQVPEPGTLALLVLGLASVGLSQRRKTA